jgi:hypothetical protein
VKRSTFAAQFVELVPKQLDEGTLYVSMAYATATHRCFCGCGMKVVTPLSPTDWQLGFDGETVTLKPSIGNWSYPCRSHYVLSANRVLWAGPMSAAQIHATRQADRLAKRHYYAAGAAPAAAREAIQSATAVSRATSAPERRLWQRMLDWWSQVSR